MFGMGFGEILVVLLIALIFLGPEKIPETASTLGKWFYELKRSLDGVKDAFEKDFKDSSSEVRKDSPKPRSTSPLAQLSSGNEENKNIETFNSDLKEEKKEEGKV